MLANVKLAVRLSKRSRSGGRGMAPFVLEASTVERLTFGIRAQRRARRKRLKRRLALVSLVLTLLGFPGATVGLELVQRILGPEPQRIARGAETTESATSLLRFRSRLFDARPLQPEESESPSP